MSTPSESRRLNVRYLFPGAEKVTYMDVAVRGLLSTLVREAVDHYLDDRVETGGDKAEMFETIERTRKRFAALINADPDEIAFTKNVSEGLNIIGSSLPWKAGDNVVLCPELEHPNNVYLWLNLRERSGAEVRMVRSRDGQIPVEEMLAAMDGRTQLVTMPTVTFAPGFIADVESIARACRERGTFCLVDAAQSVGVLHTDVRRLGVDALAVATQKGLLAFYGMGFLYCRRKWAQRLNPLYLARFGVDMGKDAHETALNVDELRLAAGARRFDLGNYNYLGATAADASLALLLESGTQNVETHVRALAARFARGMLELGMPVCGGPPGPHLGHIVAVGMSGGGRHYTADDPEMNRLYEHLSAHGVKLSVRRGVLRFSLHMYNNEEDVDRVLELTRAWKRTRPRG